MSLSDGLLEIHDDVDVMTMAEIGVKYGMVDVYVEGKKDREVVQDEEVGQEHGGQKDNLVHYMSHEDSDYVPSQSDSISLDDDGFASENEDDEELYNAKQNMKKQRKVVEMRRKNRDKVAIMLSLARRL